MRKYRQLDITQPGRMLVRISRISAIKFRLRYQWENRPQCKHCLLFWTYLKWHERLEQETVRIFSSINCIPFKNIRH